VSRDQHTPEGRIKLFEGSRPKDLWKVWVRDLENGGKLVLIRDKLGLGGVQTFLPKVGEG